MVTRLGLVLLVSQIFVAAADDVVIGDFEGTNYGDWKAVGSAFGSAPARGTLPGQLRVDGFKGKGLVNSFNGGDKTTGTLTSPSFTIERRFVTFLIGGGGYSNETCINLLVDGKVVRTAAGPNTISGGSEALQPGGWDVAEFKGRPAVLQIVDSATGGWGHINVDHIALSDRKPALEQTGVTREFAVEKRYLHFPVKHGAPRKKVEVLHNGKVVRFFDIELADGDADWWPFLDVSTWQGEKLVVRVNRLRDDSGALTGITQDATIKGAENLYREPLRPQIHFSPRRGWNNDPNGMVFYRGEYHLFFQHNPYGWDWGNMHWGHAVSTNMVQWLEVDETLYPDEMGPMFSGSGVVDWQNTSGFGRAGEPPIVLIYTAAGDPAVQCVAYSKDGGKTFAKYDGNPVLKQITPGNRDPKVYWHEPTKRWVMALYVGFDEVKDGKKSTRHTIQFFNSPNLKDWTFTSEINGFFECPDFFELPVGNSGEKKWVLNGASSEYVVGTFDGLKFTSESAKLPGHRGKGFYAAQTFADIPANDGRRIQIGWLQAPSPGMPFNQCMSLPLELKLLSTPEGPRLSMWPVKEVEALNASTQELRLGNGNTAQFESAPDQPLRFEAAFTPGADSVVEITISGVPIVFDAAKQELSVKGHRASAPLREGKQRLVVYTDRTAFEVFASDGLTYVPWPVIPKSDAKGGGIVVRGAPVKFDRLTATPLQSIWR